MKLPHIWRRHDNFSWCEDCGAFEWRDEQGRRCTAFPRLCVGSSDKGPEVDEEFVDKWAKDFSWMDGSMTIKSNLIQMLREAGVRVKEGGK